MQKRVDAKLVDAVEIRAAVEGGRIRVHAKVAPELGIVDGFLALFRDRDLDLVTAGTRAGDGFDTDYINVSIDKDETYVSAVDDTIIMPSAAFDRLVARLSRAVIEAAKHGGAPITREAWWGKAQEDANAIVARAYPKGL